MVPILLEDLKRDAVDVRVLDQTVPTLGYEEMLIYLCIHGASHCWDKLESILSISKIIQSGRIPDWNRVLRSAEQMRCKRMVLLGMLLSEILFGAELPKPFQGALSNDKMIRKLTTRIVNRLMRDKQMASGSFGWRFSPIHFLSRDSFLDAVRYFFRLMFRPTIREWERYPLPRTFLFLYYFLRPYRIISGRIKALFTARLIDPQIIQFNTPLRGTPVKWKD